MSGVMVHAGLNRKPIIACEQGLIGWHARTFGLGVITQNNQESIISALSMLNDPLISNQMGSAGYEKFKTHTWENYSEKLQSLLHTG
jgi:glycosyltransferase involved in cell wall biosynthesis